MTADQLRRVEEAFIEASGLSLGERAQYLDRCADPLQRARVEELLADDSEILPDPVHTLLSAVVGRAINDAFGDPFVGESCGEWRIAELLGEGGMGAVYLATREGDQYFQKAAIKLLRFGPIAGDRALERFRQERRILATLDHPNITRLIDGGAYTSLSGARLPFLAMEFVDGEPLLQYAERKSLNLEARLVLFQTICHAVQFAHHNLIVHRDLKPGNILVTRSGVPKLLDFGIAKLIDPSESYETATRTFTPDYASPEQIRGHAPLPASDIYSLGAILYQLLVGKTPFERRSLAAGDLERQISGNEPVRPSARGGMFAKQLRGDLDNIILKALHKDGLRRYQSAEQLAQDLDRYLRQQPVQARPDTVVYRMSKLLRRHWVALTTTAVAFFLLAAALAVTLHEARIARQRFREVRTLANTFMFDFDREIATLPGSTRARAMLASTAQEYLDRLASTAGNDESLLLELANAYEKLADVQGGSLQSNLGLTADAIESYRKAIAILEKLSARNPKYRSRVALDLARAGTLSGGLDQPRDEALGLLAKSAELADSVHKENPGDLQLLKNAALAFDTLASVARLAYQSERAVESGRKAILLFKQLLAVDKSPETADAAAIAYANQGSALRNAAEFDVGEDAIQHALALEQNVLTTMPGDIRALKSIARMHESLASLNESDRIPSRGKLSESIAEWRKAIEIYERLAEADRNDTLTQIQYASASAEIALVDLRRGNPGDLQRADRYSERGARIMRAALEKSPNAGLGHSRLPRTGSVRAFVLARENRCPEAIELSEQALNAERAFAREVKFSSDARILLSAHLLQHAQVLVICGQPGTSNASHEAAALVAGLRKEVQSTFTFAYMAGVGRFRLGEAMELAGKRSSDPALLRAAADNYSEAATLWSPWKQGRTFIEARIVNAAAAQQRCRWEAGTQK